MPYVHVRFAAASWRVWALAPALMWGLALPAATAHAACPSVATAKRFALNGPEVTDKVTGLVWARCSVGQTWSGSTCTGMASTFTHEQALQHAQAQIGWRLPNVKELSSLLDRGCKIPTIDAVAFPAAPSNSFWSSSPYADNSADAWYVDFYYGDVSYYHHGYGYRGFHVRLVRVAQ